MTRIFKKPDLGKKERESYLKELDEKIILEEQRLIQVKESVEVSTRAIQEAFIDIQRKKQTEINDIEAQLIGKRAERANLEKPLTERSHNVFLQERAVIEREETIGAKEQAVFERERECEIKLDGIRDLSDQIGESRTRLVIRETQQKRKEEILGNREHEYLIKIDAFNSHVVSKTKEFDQRAYELGVQGLDLKSKEENLRRREQALLDGHIKLNDQRCTLERAWKELDIKKNNYGIAKRS